MGVLSKRYRSGLPIASVDAEDINTLGDLWDNLDVDPSCGMIVKSGKHWRIIIYGGGGAGGSGFSHPFRVYVEDGLVKVWPGHCAWWNAQDQQLQGNNGAVASATLSNSTGWPLADMIVYVKREADPATDEAEYTLSFTTSSEATLFGDVDGVTAIWILATVSASGAVAQRWTSDIYEFRAS